MPKLVYGGDMSRVDIEGNSLEHVLEGHLKRRPGPAELWTALGLKKGAYYRRIQQPDYPDAEDLRLVAEAFELDPVDLLLQFGLIRARPEGYTVEDPPPQDVRKEALAAGFTRLRRALSHLN